MAVVDNDATHGQISDLPLPNLVRGQLVRSKEGWTYVYLGQKNDGRYVFHLTHPFPKKVSGFEAVFVRKTPSFVVAKFPCLEGAL